MVDPRLPPGVLRPNLRIYAIGDIHGCLDRLVALHYRIAADLADRPVDDSVLIHLGDYVDRGTDSAGVLWLLAGTVAPPVKRRVDLMGNHEAMMLAAVGAPTGRAPALWLDNGGDATLESYQVPETAPASAWSGLIPQPHVQWLHQLDRAHVEDGYLFVHAGIRPGRPLAQQNEADLLWIREPFLSDTSAHERVVVHGHTPRAVPDNLPNRIGIDTGAVMGGMLTCVVLEGDGRRFISV